jgi:hypothetical protein
VCLTSVLFLELPVGRAYPWTVQLGPQSVHELFGYIESQDTRASHQKFTALMNHLTNRTRVWHPIDGEVEDSSTEPLPKRSRATPLPRVIVPVQPCVPPPPEMIASVRATRATHAVVVPPPPPPVAPTPSPPVPSITPSWVSANQDVRVWYSMLKEAGVDTNALQKLFILAQTSERGYQQALNLVDQVLLKQGRGEILRNPSGFIHSGVINAQQIL